MILTGFVLGCIVGAVLAVIVVACRTETTNDRQREESFNAGFQFGLRHADRCLDAAASSLQS